MKADSFQENTVAQTNIGPNPWNQSLENDRTMLDLEESFIALVNVIDKRIHGLVERTREAIHTKVKVDPTTTEIEILKNSAEVNWKWLGRLSEAVQTHMSNAAEYHLFHQTLLQYQISIPKLGVSEKRVNINQLYFHGTYEEANDIFHEIKTNISYYLNWWQKIETLISDSRKISPIGLKLKSADIKRPSTMLVNYKLDKINLHKGEKVFVTRNDTIQRWTIENTKQEKVTEVPSICCELSPPDIKAIESAFKLRLILSTNWTTTIMENGCNLIGYISYIISNWTTINITVFFTQSRYKDIVLKSIFTMELLLNKYWKNMALFSYMKSRINGLRAEIEISNDKEIFDDDIFIKRNTIFIDIAPQVFENSELRSVTNLKSEKFTIQKRTMDILICLYKEFHNQWETYKALIDSSTLMTVIENIKTNTDNGDDTVAKSLNVSVSSLSNHRDTLWTNNMGFTTTKTSLCEKWNDAKPKTMSSIPHYSGVDISIPAEKELCLFKSYSMPSHTRRSKINENTFQIQNKSLESLQEHRFYTITNVDQSTTSSYSMNEVNKIEMIKNSTLPSQQSNPDWNRDLYWQSNRIQPYYLILNIPRIDRIQTIKDRHQNTSLTPSQAIEKGLSDENFLEILDTETNLKCHFYTAISQGLVTLVPTTDNENQLQRTSNLTEDDFYKAIYKIDGLFDPIRIEWINLLEAIDRNVLNHKSGQMRFSKLNYCHILSAFTMGNVRGRRIQKCNIKTLPPDMTIEISTIVQL